MCSSFAERSVGLSSLANGSKWMKKRMLSNDYKDSVIGMEAQVPEEKLQFIMFQQSLNWRTGNETRALNFTP